ncbi:MAG TPA: hypothetical protein VN884_05700 [Candidatus Sulfotelmatobacter sp.]|jgi:hypothetical protein|nr:hypothetical protein [Candidatus Sulfotelmatobacter sp.]
MGRYSALVGKRVEARYRTADIYLSAVGTLVSDSGKSIFLEDRFSLGGREKTMRVEIPYQFVIRVSETHAEPSRPAQVPAPPSKKKH